MAPRPNWRGYLKLSLVSCPVALYTAASQSEKIALHMLNRETGSRLRRKLVDAETDEVVESDQQVKGYEIARGQHVVLEDEELDKIALESTHTIDIDSFVSRNDIDQIYVDTPYYLIPDGEVGEETFAVIREAMKKQNVIGLARVVLYRRERVLMLEPRGRGILATTLRYEYEIRHDKEYFDEIPKIELPSEMVKLAEHIIKTKSGKFEAAKFKDHYEDALVELIKSKQVGQPPKGPKPPPPRGTVINLMDALRRSVKESGEAETKRSGAKAERRPKPSGRKAPAARRRVGAAHTRKAG